MESPVRRDGESFLAVVPHDCRGVPRHAAVVSQTDRGRIRIENPHAAAQIVLATGQSIMPGRSIDVDDAFDLVLAGNVRVCGGRGGIATPISDTALQVEGLVAHDSVLVRGEPSRDELSVLLSDLQTADADEQSADDVVGSSAGGGDVAEHRESPDEPRTTATTSAVGGASVGATGQTAIRLIQEVLKVVRKAAHSGEFFETALRSASGMIGLDHVEVILRTGSLDEARGWSIAATYRRDGDEVITDLEVLRERELPIGSDRLLSAVLNERQTVTFDAVHNLHQSMASVMPVERAVAVPMMDDDGQVVGVLYGDRGFASEGGSDAPLQPFELLVLELMGGAISAGLNRQHQEELRSAMNGFFSREVVSYLESNDDWMRGREADVTILFCDIRGFSRVSERIGPEMTCAWINDLMSELSEPVRDTGGVLVDYIGDELMAMWNAPNDVADHRRRACEASMRMIEMVGRLNDRWFDRTGVAFDIGIGISSGVTQVGNTGSRQRFKYGPLGSVVNVASRVQNLTKHFGVRGITTESDPPPRGGTYHLRRLSRAKPLGMDNPITLYEIGPPTDQFKMIADSYETALDFFEGERFAEAARTLSNLINRHPDDFPSLSLLGRVVDALRSDDEFNAIYVPDRK